MVSIFITGIAFSVPDTIEYIIYQIQFQCFLCRFYFPTNSLWKKHLPCPLTKLFWLYVKELTLKKCKNIKCFPPKRSKHFNYPKKQTYAMHSKAVVLLNTRIAKNLVYFMLPTPCIQMQQYF